MIKYIKNIFVCSLAAYFLLAGAGFNVVSYCCDLCAGEGIDRIATNSCFDVHHFTHSVQNQQHDDVACDDINHHPDNCHLYRLNTDIPELQKISTSVLKQVQVVDLFILPSIFSVESNEYFVLNNNSPPAYDLYKTGRFILSQKAVLLI